MHAITYTHTHDYTLISAIEMYCIDSLGIVMWNPINAPGMGRFQLFDLVRYS